MPEEPSHEVLTEGGAYSHRGFRVCPEGSVVRSGGHWLVMAWTRVRHQPLGADALTMSTPGIQRRIRSAGDRVGQEVARPVSLSRHSTRPRTSRHIQRRSTPQFEFGLPSPPWMA
jgi:hypothetical protein